MDRAPRRLSAIVCVDVVGYSRLIALDETRTIRALQALYVKQVEPVVARHNGRVVKTTGDGVLLEFDSAIDAVRAAVELQEGVARSSAAVPPERRVELRIGVNLGEVVAVANGDILGDAVNVAVRLEALAEPGGVCITDPVHDALDGKLELSFRDLGEQRVKNIDRVIHVWQWTADGAARAAATTPTLPDKPSIVVLPFDAIGGSAAQQAFVDGITEDIITELSRFRQLFVIARNSAFTYKGQAVEARQIGRELGVRYVLEGSARRSGDRMRVTAQLTEAETGAHLWAERYDRVVEDIFDVQDAITRRIVASVAPAVEIAEVAHLRRVRPADLKAHEIALRAWADAWSSYISPDLAMRERAIARAEEALGMDHHCVRALMALALAHWQNANFRTGPSPEVSVKAAIAAATKAQQIDHLNHQAFIFRGLALLLAQRFDEGLADIRHGYELNPSDAGSLLARGWAESSAGNTAIGVSLLTEALRISPRDPQQFNVYTSLCAAAFIDADYAKGVEWGLVGKAQYPTFPPLLHYLALNYVGLGQVERAAAEIETLRRVAPQWLAERLAGFSAMMRPADRARGLDFLRRAVAAADDAAKTVSSLDPWS